MKRRYLAILSAAFVAALFVACAGGPKNEAYDAGTGASESKETSAAADAKPFELALFHVNDTHAKLEPLMAEFKVDIDPTLAGKRTFLELGGFPQLWTAIIQLRGQYKNSLFVHAGDVFQGTLYFTKFEGKADLDFLNSMGLDVMTLGNHEFDKGPATLSAFGAAAKFPIVCSNLDLSAEKSLSSLVKPYIVKEIDGQKVGFIGLITPDTPYISSPGPTVVFLDPVESAKKYVKELESKGVNKIILLSHMGFDKDLAFAAKVSGIDVIIGGHSHTLIGDFKDLGKATDSAYPALVKDVSGADVLIVTSWQWANAVGVLDVKFDAAGKVTSYTGNEKLLAGSEKFRIYDLPASDGKMKRVEFSRGADGAFVAKEYDGKAYAAVPDAASSAAYLDALGKLTGRFAVDKRFIFSSATTEGKDKLKNYSVAIDALKKQVATVAAEDLKRVNNLGPGPLVADSMLWKTGADISIMNPGGVRVDLAAGDVSVAQVYELQPFANTIMTMDLTGEEVVRALEDMTDFCITSYGKKPETAFVYVSGVKLTLLVNEPLGARVKDVQVKKNGVYAPIDPAQKYKIVVNNFMGTGGDKNFTLGKIAANRKIDTGFIDSDVMLEYVLGKTLKNPTEALVKNVL
jgi:5'-nucleotidase